MRDDQTSPERPLQGPVSHANGRGAPRHLIYVDGTVAVCGRQCKTCIFGSKSPIEAERLAGMIAEADKAESTIVCHQTLDQKRSAACRGYFERKSSLTLRLAQMMAIVIYVDPYDTSVIINERKST